MFLKKKKKKEKKRKKKKKEKKKKEKKKKKKKEVCKDYQSVYLSNRMYQKPLIKKIHLQRRQKHTKQNISPCS